MPARNGAPTRRLATAFGDARASPAGIRDGVEVRDAEVWQLVDQRLEQVRRLPYEELSRRARSAPEVEVVRRPSGAFRRRTRVIALPHDRLGITVRVDVDGRRPRAEAGVVITSTGATAPEWSRRGEPPRTNPFAFGPRATLAGVAIAAILLVVFLLLA
jgi:hypothetical protein